jgi:hypothetical protein
VTADRLINADKEPQNWLMNHRTFDGQRFSPLARIDRGNVKNLRLAYAAATTRSASVKHCSQHGSVKILFRYFCGHFVLLQSFVAHDPTGIKSLILL